MWISQSHIHTHIFIANEFREDRTPAHAASTAAGFAPRERACARTRQLAPRPLRPLKRPITPAQTGMCNDGEGGLIPLCARPPWAPSSSFYGSFRLERSHIPGPLPCWYFPSSTAGTIRLFLLCGLFWGAQGASFYYHHSHYLGLLDIRRDGASFEATEEGVHIECAAFHSANGDGMGGPSDAGASWGCCGPGDRTVEPASPLAPTAAGALTSARESARDALEISLPFRGGMGAAGRPPSTALSACASLSCDRKLSISCCSFPIRSCAAFSRTVARSALAHAFADSTRSLAIVTSSSCFVASATCNCDALSTSSVWV